MNAPATGTFPPNLTPTPRDAYTVAGELADAAERLAGLAERLAADPAAAVIADIDALARGIARACIELRQRRGGHQ